MPESDILSRETRLTRCDPRALSIAQLVHRKAQPRMTILFGSRAKGTWHRFSDLDLLVIAEWAGDDDKEQALLNYAHQVADNQYGKDFIPIDAPVYEPNDLALYSRSVNHVIRRALNHGILLPETCYNDARYCRPPADYSGEPYLTASILRRSEIQRQQFHEYAEDPRFSYDPFTGRHAHQAVNSGLKALISACFQKYPITWDLTKLATAATAADPHFHWEPGIDPAIYNQYAPDREDEPAQQPITKLPNYARLVDQDIRYILERTKEIRFGHTA